MQEIIKDYLNNDKELCKKYLKAEKKYYKKLGDKYEKISFEIDLDKQIIKNLFMSLANSNICFDDFINSLLKVEIVRKEMESL